MRQCKKSEERERTRRTGRHKMDGHGSREINMINSGMREERRIRLMAEGGERGIKREREIKERRRMEGRRE